MIKNVSSTFKANCKKDSVKYREYIVIDNKEVDIKGNLTDTAYKDTTFFGKFNLKMLKFETENDIDYKKKEFTYYKEVDGEALKIGTFIVTDVSDSDTFESVNVTAYDYGLKFANPYKSTLNYSDGNVTLFQVIQEICTNCGVELENASLPNGTFIVDSNQFVNGEQFGDVVAQASVINGMFATINSNDKLEFIFTNETNEIIEDYVELDDKRDTHPITSVLVATSEDLETAGAVKKDQSLIEQYGEHWLKIYSYGFAYSTEKCQQLVNAIFNQVKGFAYSSFKSEYSFLPYLSLGDKIKFKNKEGKLVDSIILRYETNYDEITLEAPSIISASVKYTLPETDEQKIAKVGIEVNQALKEINLLSEKIVDISAQASGHKEVELENCSATPLYKLKITGDDSLLFPGDKKKHFTYETYEGSSIDVDIKGSIYDINNLDVKGRSTQEVRSGKNLFIPLGSKTVSGITVTENNDGTYNISGTATSNIEYTGFISLDNSKVINGETYILSSNKDLPAGLTARIEMYNDATWLRVFVPSIGAINKTQTGVANTTDTTRVRFGMFISSGTTLDIKNIGFQLEKGSTVTPYEQYGVSPSPDYPSEIETVKGNIQIINTGKNLFDISSFKMGSIIGTDTTIRVCSYQNIYLEAGTYTFSTNLSSTFRFNLTINSIGNAPLNAYPTYSYNSGWKTSTPTFTFTITESGYFTVLLSKADNSTLTLNDIKDFTYMLNKGSTVTEYEPYQSQTLNIDLQGNELCSIGDTKDILDISVTGDTKINKKIGKVVLDGSESWTKPSDNLYNAEDLGINHLKTSDIVGIISSNYIGVESMNSNAEFLNVSNNLNFTCGLHTNGKSIRFKDTRGLTLEEFKTWLSNNPVTVYYVLETPKTINLSPTNPLYLYDGINHLTNDNNADMVAKMVKSTMFLKTSDLYVNQGQPNEKKYDLKIPALRELNGVKDEYNLEDTKATLTKRIGLNANLEEYILTKPQIIDLGEMTIELNEGTNILTMPSFPNNYYEVTYLLKNEYTDTFANQAQVSSMINIASDEILIKSKTEILENGDELIASINTQSTGNVLINASRLAEINANKINFNSYDFNVTTQNMKISIGQGDNKKDIINSNGVLTNLIYNGYTRGSMITGTGDYIPLGRVGGGDTKDTQRNEMIFSFKLPQNFTIQSAKIYLSHAPIKWNISGTSITGYSRNLELYKGQNIESLKINYDVVNSIINTGGVTTDKIYDVLGTNGFSGNATKVISTKSAELKDYIDVDKDNYFIIKDSNETAYTTNNDIFGRTGGVFGYLEIIGYSQV